jgi:xylono-1,5-lactonase
MTPKLVWPVAAELGEGPVWFPREQALRFVDIRRGLLHRFAPNYDVCETQPLGGKPSFVLPVAGGGLLVGSGHTLTRVDAKGFGDVVATLDMPSHNRINDGTVDRAGRIWFGTMDDEEAQATGALWCLDRGQLYQMGGQAVVTNGPAVSADGSLLYHVDSSARTIWRFNIGTDQAGRPSISRKEVFLQLTKSDGYPDGVVLDAEDCLWVALWDGWCVRRYAPDGSLLCQIDFPCARVTKLAFGGPNLRTAFVTTARTGLDGAALAVQPLAGALFAFDAPVAGVPLAEAALTSEAKAM